MTTDAKVQLAVALMEDLGEADTAQVAEHLGVCRQSAARILVTAHEQGLAHINRWEGKTSSRPIWVPGKGENAKKSVAALAICSRLQSGPMSILRLARELKMSKSHVSDRIATLHASGEVHVKRYDRDEPHNGGPEKPIYALGPGEDAICPYRSEVSPPPTQTRRPPPNNNDAGPHKLTLAGLLGIL